MRAKTKFVHKFKFFLNYIFNDFIKFKYIKMSYTMIHIYTGYFQ